MAAVTEEVNGRSSFRGGGGGVEKIHHGDPPLKSPLVVAASSFVLSLEKKITRDKNKGASA